MSYSSPSFFTDPFAEKALRARLGLMDHKKLFAAIDADPDLIGAGVLYIDAQGTKARLREFEPVCFVKPVIVVLREPPLKLPPLEYIAETKSTPRESRLVMEAVGVGLSCTAAVLGWVVVATATATIPFTGGGTVFLAALGTSAAAASTIQCGNSVYRTWNEVDSPKTNDWLDSEDWYQSATLALDVISLGGATATGMVTFKGVKLLVSKGKTPLDALKGLSRAERKRFTDEIIKVRHPGVSNRMLKAMKQAGEFPARFTNEIIRGTTIRQIKDALGAGLSVTGSLSGGALNKIAIAIYAEE